VEGVEGVEQVEQGGWCLTGLVTKFDQSGGSTRTTQSALGVLQGGIVIFSSAKSGVCKHRFVTLALPIRSSGGWEVLIVALVGAAARRYTKAVYAAGGRATTTATPMAAVILTMYRGP
jgi:hypothetical protein